MEYLRAVVLEDLVRLFSLVYSIASKDILKAIEIFKVRLGEIEHALRYQGGKFKSYVYTCKEYRDIIE